MPPIDPRLVRAKRYPVHAAVCTCYAPEMERLLTEDAPFHVGRKVPDLEIGVLHSACASRPGNPAPEIFYKIARYLVKMGAPINEKDSVGQTALHYAVCHHYAFQLVKILIDSGADLNPRREVDGWTPLHLAAMFGKMDVTQVLLEAGARASVKGTAGETPEDVAKRYRHHALADILHSPRIDFHPKSFPSEFEDLFKPVNPDQGPPAQPIKITDALVSWRDEEGNTLLHLSAWLGRIFLSRAFFDSIKGRKLVTVQNRKGAVPLAMAIIAGQDKMTEEFFMNKNSKKLIDFGMTLNDSKENIVHLMLKYCPNVHPKFILKRKDLTKEHLNAQDSLGETPLLHLARRNSSPTIRKILESKNVRDNELLDLTVKSGEGKTVLHYLVEHRDEQNIASLLDRAELTAEVANAADANGRAPLVTCLLHGSPYMARDILEHPTAKDKFRLDLCYTSDGRSPLHLVAEQGNGALWQLAVSRPDCDMNARDAGGNTPLMSAAICGRAKMLETFLRDVERAKQVDLSLVNLEGKTLLILLIEHIPDIRLLKLFLRTVDAKESINQIDKSCHTALTAAIHLSKWNFVKELLTNMGLKTGDPLQEDTLEGTIDVHPVNDEGQSALTMMVLARIKLARQEQTYLMKKQRSLAVEAKKEQEALWELIKLMLVREKEQHGTSMVQGRDGGSDCIKSQLSVAKLIRPPNVDEVVQEFAKQYQFLKRKRPPPSSTPATPATQGPAPTTAPPPVPTSEPPTQIAGPPPSTAPPPVPDSDQETDTPVSVETIRNPDPEVKVKEQLKPEVEAKEKIESDTKIKDKLTNLPKPEEDEKANKKPELKKEEKENKVSKLEKINLNEEIKPEVSKSKETKIEDIIKREIKPEVTKVDDVIKPRRKTSPPKSEEEKAKEAKDTKPEIEFREPEIEMSKKEMLFSSEIEKPTKSEKVENEILENGITEDTDGNRLSKMCNKPEVESKPNEEWVPEPELESKPVESKRKFKIGAKVDDSETSSKTPVIFGKETTSDKPIMEILPSQQEEIKVEPEESRTKQFEHPDIDENVNKKAIEALIIDTPPTPPRRIRRGFVDVGVQTDISGLNSETCTCSCHLNHHQTQ